MGEASFVIAGRTYRVGCADGEEAHVAALAARLDAEAATLATRLGAVTEPRLLLMVALMMADQLHDAEQVPQAASSADDSASLAAQLAAAEAALTAAEQARDGALARAAEAEAALAAVPATPATNGNGQADLFTPEHEAALATRLEALAVRIEQLTN